MNTKEHHYSHRLIWTGNTGSGTSTYRAYERAHSVEVAGKPTLFGSSDPSFRGDAARHNPEDLFVASISSCHMLWYLGLCAAAGVTVIDYEDLAEGFMLEEVDGSGRFTRVNLRPRITVSAQSNIATAERLHDDAHKKCFIANSVSFNIDVQATIVKSDETASAAAA